MVTLHRAAIVPAVFAVGYTAYNAPLSEAVPAVQVTAPPAVALVVVLIVWLTRRDRSRDGAAQAAAAELLAARESEQVESEQVESEQVESEGVR